MKLDAKNVSVSIAGKPIVRNLSIEVPDLKFSALLGANGSGKTTLLRSIYRTQKMDSGIVRLDDEDITHFSGKKLARNMAVMGQFNQINFDYTVLDIALMGRYPFHSLLEQEKERDYEMALEALDKVGMKSYQKFKESVFFRKLFLLAFVTSLVLFRTLLNRNLWMNPLSDVMGGWGIWETVNGEQKLTTECLENVIMMVPFSGVVLWTFEEKIGNGWKKILWQSGKVAFGFSLMIEMLQLLLRLGTFQLSDIFYNTVGGVLGGVCYCGIKKVIQKI